VAYTEKGAGFLGAIYLGILASVYTVVANIHYWLGVLKGKLKSAGASIGHIGFGLVLLGIFLSSSIKQSSVLIPLESMYYKSLQICVKAL
jgi:cytochrome c-type biogenesis protein CcmF